MVQPPRIMNINESTALSKADEEEMADRVDEINGHLESKLDL
jgi:hypothetical protein